MTASQHTIAGQVVTMPVKIRKAIQHMAMFSVDADAAQQMIDYSGLKVCRYLPGRAIVVLMLWLYLTAYLVILGAELNAELERPVATGRAAADHPSGSMSPPRGSTAVGSV